MKFCYNHKFQGKTKLRLKQNREPLRVLILKQCVNLLSSAVDRWEVFGVAVGEWGNDKECDWWWLRGEKQKRELHKSSLFVVPPELYFLYFI